MSITIKQGTVKYPGDRLFDNPYRPGEEQQNLVCTMDDGSEERLYFQAFRKPHYLLNTGDRVQIIYDKDDSTGKTKRRLVPMDNDAVMQRADPQRECQKTPAHNTAQKPDFYQQKYSGNGGQKQSAAVFITEKLAIYNLVLERVKSCDFAIELTVSDLSDIATSILIEGSKKNIDFTELLVTQNDIVPESVPVTPVNIEPLQYQTSYEAALDEIPF